jgi:hypothetical protein
MDDKAERSDSSVTPSAAGSDNDYNNKSNVAKEEGEGGDVARQQSRVESIWPADKLTLPREVAMIFVVCMAQFCTRKFLLATYWVTTAMRSWQNETPFQFTWLN